MGKGGRCAAAAGLLAAVALAASCANADVGAGPDAAGSIDASVVDAAPLPDATANSGVDAAAPDAGAADAGAADAGSTDGGGCVSMWLPLLTNGDFDAGATAWTEDTGGSATAIIRDDGDLPFAAFSPTWAAVVLGYSNADVSLSQAVTVPADATMLRLTGYACWVTEDTDGDTMTIELRDDTGALLETLDDIQTGDAGATCGWTAFSYDAAAAHAGETIGLVLAGTSDSATVTSFAFDSLSLEALVCR